MDVSNFQEFDSWHSDDNPLTSTPIKMSAQEKEQSSMHISPLPPPFMPAYESSISDAVSENDSSRFDVSEGNVCTSVSTSTEPASSTPEQVVTRANSTSIEPANSTSTQAAVSTEPANSTSVHADSGTGSATNNNSSNQWFGYVVIGDNVDKKVKPRHMRSDNQSTDLHYFHLYAAKDRIDLSGASEEPPSLNPDAVLSELLPTDEDIEEIKSNFGVLIARQLIQYFPYFEKHFSDVVIQHISHAHEAEMKEASEVVSVIMEVVN